MAKATTTVPASAIESRFHGLYKPEYSDVIGRLTDHDATVYAEGHGRYKVVVNYGVNAAEKAIEAAADLELYARCVELVDHLVFETYMAPTDDAEAEFIVKAVTKRLARLSSAISYDSGRFLDDHICRAVNKRSRQARGAA